MLKPLLLPSDALRGDAAGHFPVHRLRLQDGPDRGDDPVGPFLSGHLWLIELCHRTLRDLVIDLAQRAQQGRLARQTVGPHLQPQQPQMPLATGLTRIRQHGEYVEQGAILRNPLGISREFGDSSG